MLTALRHRVAWLRSHQVADARLMGAWVPDPSEAGAAYAVSLVFEPEHLWTVLRQEDGLHRVPMAYRAIDSERLLVRIHDRLSGMDHGTPSPVDVRVVADDVLVYRGRRYRRADDPDDRPWPPELRSVG